MAPPVAKALPAQLQMSMHQSGAPLQGFMREAVVLKLKRLALEICAIDCVAS